MNQAFKNYLLSITNSSDCKEAEVIQRLWSGYGKISRYQLMGSAFETVVVKHISLNPSEEHPRGWNTDLGHQRKVKSYRVETHWYQEWNQQCAASCRVPECLGSFSEGLNQWIVLEDLDANFPMRKQELVFSEVVVCLKWLANFHVTFLGQKPLGLWEVGTYWHLKTRSEEFEKINHAELKSKAHIIDDILSQCQYQTIVHGDAKLANFCFSENGRNVAAVDFQYVGGGCGMKDVAYFLGSCLSSSECELYETELLKVYFSELETALLSSDVTVDFKALEQEWRRLYPIAIADFTRFLMGWMPTHQKVNNYHISAVNAVLLSL